MRRVALVALLVALPACSRGAAEAQEFAGNWVSETWGTYLSIDGGSARVYEFTEVHCFEVAGGGVRGVSEVLSLENDQLVLSDAGRLVRFDPVEFLPTECAADVVGDPESVYDVLVATIENHHAPGVDAEWGDRVERLRPAQDAGTDALFTTLTELLDPLDHPDIRVAAPDRAIWRSLPAPDARLLDGTRSGNAGIVVATLGPGIRYVGLERMGGFGSDEADSVRTIAGVIDDAVAADTLVLDLRPTDGGSVTDAMVVASRFVPEDQVVAEYSAFGPDGFEDGGFTGVRPLPAGTYEGDLFVLVGPGTAGPAELLAQAIAEAGGAELVGAPTAGSPAPRMVRQLPNGWVFGLANLTATTAAGSDLSTGVQPTVPTDDPLLITAELAGFEL